MEPESHRERARIGAAAGWTLLAALLALWLYSLVLAAGFLGSPPAAALLVGVALAAGMAALARRVFRDGEAAEPDPAPGDGDGPDGWTSRLRSAWREMPAFHRWALGAVLFAGLLLRIDALFQPIRYDEAFTYLRFASRPFRDALSTYPVPNNHLLNTLLMGVVGRTMGDAPALLRLPAFLAGLALLPATYWIGLRLWDRSTALLGTAVCAVSPTLILYATNARGYAMVALGFVVLLALARAISREPRRRWTWLGLIVTGALGAYAVPVFLYPFGGVCAWLALELAPERGRRRSLPKLATAAGLTGVAAAGLYSPVIAREGLAALFENRWVEPRSLGAFLADLPTFLGQVGEEWAAGLPLVVAAGLALALLAGLPSLLAPRRRWMATGVLGWALLLLLLTRRAPFARIWLYLLPLAALVAGAGLRGAVGRCAARLEGGARGERIATGGLVALLLAAGGWVLGQDEVRRLPDTGSLPHGDEVAAWLAEHLGSGDAVRGALPSNTPIAFYFSRRDDASLELLRRPPGRALYLVVNEAHGQSLASVAGGLGVPDRFVARAELVFERPQVKVYRIGG